MLRNFLNTMVQKYPFIRGRSRITQILSKYFLLKEGTVVKFDDGLDSGDMLL